MRVMYTIYIYINDPGWDICICICIYIYIYMQYFCSIIKNQICNGRRYIALTKTGTSSSGGELARFSKDVFMSGAFGRLVYYLTGVSVLGGRTQVRRFRPGLDYSVASG